MAIQYADNENFSELINSGFVIADFFSTTCVPCRMFSAILEDIEAEIPFINIVKANISDYPELGDQYDISAVPTIHFYKDGKLMYTFVGVMDYDSVKEKISEYMY